MTMLRIKDRRNGGYIRIRDSVLKGYLRKLEEIHEWLDSDIPIPWSRHEPGTPMNTMTDYDVVAGRTESFYSNLYNVTREGIELESQIQSIPYGTERNRLSSYRHGRVNHLRAAVSFYVNNKEEIERLGFTLKDEAA